MTANQLQYWANQETMRSNKAKEAETQRHNEVEEQYKLVSTVTGALKDLSQAGKNVSDAITGPIKSIIPLFV